MATLAEVLAAHLFTLYPGEIACGCEWTQQDENSRAGDRRMIAAHVDHATAAVTAHLAEILAADATREAVERAIQNAAIDNNAWITSDDEARSVGALAAVRVALGIGATT